MRSGLYTWAICMTTLVVSVGLLTSACDGSKLHHLVVKPAESYVRVGVLQKFTVQGMDKNGKDLGDLTASSTFAIQPDGNCKANTCTADANGTHTIIATKDGKSGTATLIATDSNATSDALIDQAVAAGELDPDMGLIYKTFAAYGDSRLPTRYRGAPDPTDASGVADELAARYPSMPVSLRSLAYPFLIPPEYTQSWYFLPTSGTVRIGDATAASAPANPPLHPCSPGDPTKYTLSPQWDDTTVGAAVNGTYRVWFDKERNLADNSAEARTAALVRDAAVYASTSLMMLGMEGPLPDGGDPSRCQGPDSAIDLFVANQDQSLTHRLGKFPAPAWVDFAAFDSLDHLQGAVAHELTHVMQYSYNNPLGKTWYTEAMAEWAQSYVYPDGDTEVAAWEPDRIERPLDPGDPYAPDAYQAWTMLLYLEKVTTAKAVVNTWNLIGGSGSTPEKALDTILGKRAIRVSPRSGPGTPQTIGTARPSTSSSNGTGCWAVRGV